MYLSDRKQVNITPYRFTTERVRFTLRGLNKLTLVLVKDGESASSLSSRRLVINCLPGTVKFCLQAKQFHKHCRTKLLEQINQYFLRSLAKQTDGRHGHILYAIL